MLMSKELLKDQTLPHNIDHKQLKLQQEWLKKNARVFWTEPFLKLLKKDLRMLMQLNKSKKLIKKLSMMKLKGQKTRSSLKFHLLRIDKDLWQLVTEKIKQSIQINGSTFMENLMANIRTHRETWQKMMLNSIQILKNSLSNQMPVLKEKQDNQHLQINKQAQLETNKSSKSM